MHTVVGQCKEEGIENGDAKEGLVEAVVLHQLSDQPPLVNDELLEWSHFIPVLWSDHAHFQSLHSHAKQCRDGHLLRNDVFDRVTDNPGTSVQPSWLAGDVQLSSSGLIVMTESLFLR